MPSHKPPYLVRTNQRSFCVGFLVSLPALYQFSLPFSQFQSINQSISPRAPGIILPHGLMPLTQPMLRFMVSSSFMPTYIPQNASPLPQVLLLYKLLPGDMACM